MARFFVSEPYAAYVEERLRDLATLRGRSGFLRHLLLRPTSYDRPYVVTTFWERASDFEAWNRSESAIEGGARLRMLPRDAFRGRGSVETFETFGPFAGASTERVAAEG